MRDALYIAAKAPRPNLAKTRLGRAIGHDRAAALYGAFLTDLASRFADGPFDLRWHVTPADAWTEISPLVARGGPAPRVSVQSGRDWATRQGQLFRGAARRENRIVLIASDSPHLGVEVVRNAFRKLDRHDLVLGPTEDGGYYLIGQRATAVRHDVLRGVRMSTGTELGSVTARAVQAGLSVGWVEATFDVDEIGDLERLRPLAAARPDLAATRAALEALGLSGDGEQTGGAGADPTGLPKVVLHVGEDV